MGALEGFGRSEQHRVSCGGLHTQFLQCLSSGRHCEFVAITTGEFCEAGLHVAIPRAELWAWGHVFRPLLEWRVGPGQPSRPEAVHQNTSVWVLSDLVIDASDADLHWFVLLRPRRCGRRPGEAMRPLDWGKTFPCPGELWSKSCKLFEVKGRQCFEPFGTICGEM